MTVPAGAALNHTLTPGAQPKLLTEYAGGPDNPVYIINEDPAGPRVFLSSSSNVTAQTGLPVEPGTSSSWSEPGALYAIADPAGSTPATIVISAAGFGWQVSPAAVALVVAEQLLAQGVPSVWTNDGVVLQFGFAAGAFIDVNGLSKYASLLISHTSGDGNARTSLKVDMHQASSVGGFFDAPPNSEYLTSADSNGPTSQWLVPIRGGSARLTNNGPGSLGLQAYASNRPADRVLCLGEQAGGVRLTITAAILAGVATAFTSPVGGNNSTFLNGPCKVIDTQGLAAGTISMRYADIDGSQRSVNVMTTQLNVPQTVDWDHPKARVQWIYTPNNNVAAGNQILVVMPGQT